MAYDWSAIGNQIDTLKNGGNEAQAYAMFNGLSGMGNATAAAGGNAGNLDSYLRTRWGDDQTKQWVNNMDTKYGNTLFDPATGKWAGMGQANGQSGTIAGWDPTQYNAGGMGSTGAYTPSGYGSGAGGFAPPGGRPDPSAGLTKPPMPGAQPPGAPPMGGGATPPVGGGAPSAPGAAGSPWDFFNDEGYKFRLGEGMKGIQGQAAAGGMLQSGKTLKALASYNQGLASDEYGAAHGRWADNRDFGESQLQDRRNFGESQFQDRRDFGEDSRRYEQGFGEDQRRYNQGFGEDQRRYNQGFGESQRRNDRDFDYAFGKDQRDYETGLDRYNQQFDYGAGIDDRNWKSNTLMSLANMGLGATGQSGNLANSMANIFGQNTMTGAGAGAAGAVGGANNTNSMISQLMQYLQGQQMLNTYGGRQP